jgi:hypothetical protein
MIKHKVKIPQPTIEVPSRIKELAAASGPLRYVSFDLETAAKSREFEIQALDTTILPAITVTLPDSWPYIKIAPLYDVHLGSREMDVQKFARDLKWLANEPYTVTWNGGDLWDNAIKSSIASSFSNNASPNDQYAMAMDILKTLLPKMMFGIPGNHEQRTARTADIDVPKIMHEQLGIPYSPDYMACTIKWRNNKFRILAHHGTGAAASAGGQRNAARKDICWAHGFDMYWTGHLHQPLSDTITIKTFDTERDIPIEKEVYCIISPSYLKYFGGYAAAKRLAPGARGLTIVTCHEDGRMDVENHANGPRL